MRFSLRQHGTFLLWLWFFASHGEKSQPRREFCRVHPMPVRFFAGRVKNELPEERKVPLRAITLGYSAHFL
jgi:hypothetical protein